MQETTFIYALCEPGTRTIRYIGKSGKPAQRVKQHWVASSQLNNHLGNWLRQLDNPPSLLILKEVLDLEWEDWERRYIENARMLGFDLVNSTDGGEGVTMTSQTRVKISNALTGIVRSVDTRRKISAAQKGKQISLVTREKISSALTGRKHTKEHSEKVGLAHKGKEVSEECRQKLREHNLGKKQSLETINKRAAKLRNPSQETIDKRTSKTRGQKRTPEQRLRMSAAQKKNRERISAAMTEVWERRKNVSTQ